MTVISFAILVIVLVFYGAYLVKMVLLRRSGIVANRLGRGDKSAYNRVLEIVGTIATYGMVVVQGLSIYGVFTRLDIGKYSGLIGVALAFAGTMFFIRALIAMKDSWRAGIDRSQKTTLRTEGILRWSRNPAFLGFDLFYIGVALATPNILIFILVAIAVVFFHLQILEEEKYLAATFGDDYLEYKQKVRRYL